jgi:hypothetical protein
MHSRTYPEGIGESPLRVSGFGTVQAASIPGVKGRESGGRDGTYPGPCPVTWGSTYQGPTAEQDHENNEGLEPVVLHNLEAGPAEGPPHLSTALGDVHIEAGEALHTGCRAGQVPHYSPGAA